MTAQAYEGAPVDERVERYLRKSGLMASTQRVLPLTGDASDRRYFRILLADGNSVVLALHAGPIDFETLPFARVAELLGKIPLPVPAIRDHADADGVLLLEDLGDVTLQAHLGAASLSEHATLYRSAVGLIELLQRRGAELASDRYPPYGITFDVDKLTWELDFFVRHFLEAYRGASLSATERAALDDEWAAMTTELAAESLVLCHRDYHSRNLMVHESRLYLIDFQDARLGPDTYDLASLLRDSYVDVEDRELDELIAYFLALKGVTAANDIAMFRSRFDLVALQRNLKALGTFGYQTTTRSNAVYIQYIPRTLRYVRANLAKYARFGRLLDVLAAHIAELR
jgi:aminoglycoside/choline kinase family phosphotransferase